MFRGFIALTRNASFLAYSKAPKIVQNAPQSSLVRSTFQRYFSFMQPRIGAPLFANSIVSPSVEPTRTLIKFSIRKGKRKSVKAVIRRFYRLHWGGWIRRIAGCHKKLWKKRMSRRRRLLKHVLCNATQSRLLDKMVGPYWRKPRYYVNDPYEPYHTREEFQFTYKTPKPYFPPEKS